MKNASKAIRNAYYTALHGNITYSGTTVAVYKDVPVETVPDHFIQIIGIDETNDPNDAKFIRDVVVTIDVVTRQYRYKSRDTVDEISEDLQQIILSTVGGSLLDANFQIGHIQLEASRYLDGTEGEYYITRKILQFNQTLIQY